MRVGRFLDMLFGAMLLAVTAAGCSDPETERFSATAPVLADQGAAHYARYCASCHGVGGGGGGPVTVVLRELPPDLTKIATRRDGVFPTSEIRQHIDGRIAHPAHGTREMPIWGERFNQEVEGSAAPDELARGRLYALVDYLQSIQTPPPSRID